MDIKKVLVFNIKGKAAHFKKYYSNKSSLTYKIPTRTVLMGMVASILKYPRDSYYDVFSPEKAKLGVRIEKGGSTHFECMNYLKSGGGHTQVRLQLLLPKEDTLVYTVFFTHEDIELVEKLAKKLKNSKLGYGLFLGQRQFRATVDYKHVINKVKVKKNYIGELTTLTYKKNIKKIDINNNIDLTIDNMPASFKKVKKGRKPQKMIEVCYEENGENINGKFKEVIELNTEPISFYTPVRGS
jgi:CRISPR-associated protein Cas5h